MKISDPLLKIRTRSRCEDGENKIFKTNVRESKKLDILDSFNYNTNLDIRFQNIKNKKYTISINYIVQFYTFAQVDPG